MIGASPHSPPQPLGAPGRKTASGGLRLVAPRRAWRTGWQAADASGKNRMGRPWSRRGAVLPQNLTCKGTATFSAVGPLPQAPGDSAFAPGTKPANGTVAIAGAKTFGFGRQALREGKAGAIKINPQGLDDLLKETGGPLSPYTVGDYGDVNIRNAPGSRFDIYRFSTQKGALTFGKRTVPVIITVPAGGHCPPGTTAQ